MEAVIEYPDWSPILVTGGTGTLGRLVVARLMNAGCNVRVLSRRRLEPRPPIEFIKGDLATGEGIDAAVKGAEVIVHCAGSARGDERKAQHLARAAARAGARHLVYISVVGDERIPVEGAIDRAMFGYFGSKLAAHRVVAESGVPWTTLPATQFYDLALMVAQQMARLPMIPFPSGFWFQPVDADEVAQRLVELALSAPAGRVPDMGGPRVYAIDELVRGYLRAIGRRRPLIAVRLPGRAAAAIRAGAALPQDAVTGRKTWEEFLAARIHSSASGYPSRQRAAEAPRPST